MAKLIEDLIVLFQELDTTPFSNSGKEDVREAIKLLVHLQQEKNFKPQKSEVNEILETLEACYLFPNNEEQMKNIELVNKYRIEKNIRAPSNPKPNVGTSSL